MRTADCGDAAGRKVMDWLNETTSIAGIQIRNGWIVLGAAFILVLLIYTYS